VAGRTDVRTAVRLAVAFSVLGSVATLASAAPSASGSFASAVQTNLLLGITSSLVVLVALYLTIEPVLRRTWPESLVSWIRLFEGRLRDPRVGRDVLFGLIGGVGTAVVISAAQWAVSHTSLPQPVDARWDDGGLQTDVLTLGGWPLSVMAQMATFAIGYGFVTTGALSLVTRTTGRRWLGISAALFVSLLWMGGVPDGPFGVFQSLLATAATVTIFLRGGLLSMIVAFFAMVVTKSFPFELPGRSWYWEATIMPTVVFAALAIWSFVSMFGGRPVLALPAEDAPHGSPMPISQRETVG
jgi:hypothetical protein